jgi:hypothetical protein
MVSPLDVQRLFLQSVISRRVISADLAKVLWGQCVQAVKGLALLPCTTLISPLSVRGYNSCRRYPSNKRKWARRMERVLELPEQITRSPRPGTLPNTQRRDGKGGLCPSKRALTHCHNRFTCPAGDEPRSIAGTTKSPASPATIRRSRYPTSEHWYAYPPADFSVTALDRRSIASRLNRSCSLRIVHTPSPPWPPCVR